METGRNRWQFKQLDTDDILVESYCIEDLNKLKVLTKSKRSIQKIIHKFLAEEQIRKETARCLGCGATIVDANKCIGCGVCTTKCEFDAIKTSSRSSRMF
ncbi:MAG: 4Fe-4S binding protein [Faecalibacillus faecis]